MNPNGNLSLADQCDDNDGQEQEKAVTPVFMA